MKITEVRDKIISGKAKSSKLIGLGRPPTFPWSIELAVRCLGPLTKERVHVVFREACAIVEEELEAAAAEGKMEIPWQYFAALLPVRSVGVQLVTFVHTEKPLWFVQYNLLTVCSEILNDPS